MSKIEEAAALMTDLDDIEKNNISEMRGFDWNDWAKLPQSKLLLELFIIQKFLVLENMVEKKYNGDDFISDMSELKGEYRIHSYFIDLISNLRSGKE